MRNTMTSTFSHRILGGLALTALARSLSQPTERP